MWLMIAFAFSNKSSGDLSGAGLDTMVRGGCRPLGGGGEKRRSKPWVGGRVEISLGWWYLDGDRKSG